jgi:hypothetical protein
MLQIGFEVDGDGVLLTLRGELDMASASRLRMAGEDVLADFPGPLRMEPAGLDQFFHLS